MNLLCSLLLICCFSVKSGIAKSQNGTVGMSCRGQDDCHSGNYCTDRGKCACAATHVEVDAYCWRKVHLGQTGCVIDRQCNSVWPGARCQSSVCMCGANERLLETRDGNICIDKRGVFCPTNGEYPKFHMDNKVQQCNSDSACESLGAFAYDCINVVGGDGKRTKGFCCPSKAMTCAQPPNEGVYPGSGSTSDPLEPRSPFGADRHPPSPILRWFFDSVTGVCRVMSFKGVGGNANNFLTKEHCESYCSLVLVCPRGLALYRKGRGGAQKQEPLICNKGGYTDINYQCTARPFPFGDHNFAMQATQQYYCPTTDFICSRNGGIPTKIYKKSKHNGLPTDPFDVGTPDVNENIQRAASQHRFYFDAKLGKCVQFPYLGQGGNFNNFITRRQCEEFCFKPLCSHGDPLKEGNGAREHPYLECSPDASKTGISTSPSQSNSTECPSTHMCEATPFSPSSNNQQGVCCPRPQFVCNLPVEKGACKSSFYGSITRWWFNSRNNKCEKIPFKACSNANANNFASQKQCQEYCRYAKICPSSLVPMPDDGIAPYRFCNPYAPGDHPVEGCGCAGNSCHGNGHCHYSKNLKRHICCAVDFSDHVTLKPRTTVVANQPLLIEHHWVSLGSSGNDASWSKRCPPSEKNCEWSFLDYVPIYWLLGLLGLILALVILLVSKLRLHRMLLKLAHSMEPTESGIRAVEPTITCVYNPYSECPVELLKNRRGEGEVKRKKIESVD